MGLFAVVVAFIGGIIFTIGALVMGVIVGLGKITSKFEKTAMENKYPDVGNKQYEPSPKKATAPAPPPLAYTGLSGTGCTPGVTATPSTNFISQSGPLPTKKPEEEIGELESKVGHQRSHSLTSISELEKEGLLSKAETVGNLQTVIKDKKAAIVVIKEGLLEIKSSKDWSKRYLVLRRGYIAIYKTEKGTKASNAACVGLVKLEGCSLSPLHTKKKGKFPFEVIHNKRARIYCHAGPHGERVTQKFPTKCDRISFQAKEREEMEQWTSAIEEAIAEAPPFLKFTGEDDASLELGDDKEDGGSETDSSDDESDDEGSDEDDDTKVFKEVKEAVISTEEKEKEKEVVVVRDNIVIPEEKEKDSAKVVGRDGELKVNLKNWLKYYFILGQGVLAFYKSNDMKELVGAVKLEGCEVTAVNQQDDSKSKKKPTFTLEISHPEKKEIFMKESSSGRKLHVTPPLWHVCQLRTKTENSRAEWISAIQLMINDSKQTAYVPLVSPDAKSYPVPWINLILSRHFKDMADSKVFHMEMMRRMKKKFDTLNRPDFLGPVVCEKIFFGTEMVQVKSVKMTGTNQPNELVGEADIVYNGGGGLEINTELFVNWPSDKFASIPVNAVVKLTHLAGKLHFHLPAELGARFTAFFAKLPEVDFSIEVLMGEKQRKATSLPKFKKFILSTLRRALRQQLVYPNKITLHLPFPGRKMDLKTETWGSLFRRRTTYNTREASFAYESTDAIARKFAVARFVNEIFNHNNFEGLNELCAKEIILHGYNPFAEDASGFEGVKEVAREIKLGFSNGKFSISDIAIETNNAIVRWKFRGTHDGVFWDSEPSNEEMLLTGVSIMQFNTDKVYEVWTYWDPSSIFAF